MVDGHEGGYSPPEYEGVGGMMARVGVREAVAGGRWDGGAGRPGRGFEGLSLHWGNVGKAPPPPPFLQGPPDRRCRPPHPGHFPADVDLQAGIRRRREAVRGAEVPLRPPQARKDP